MEIKRCDNDQAYPFFWLDELVEVTLNPLRSNLKLLTREVLNGIQKRLPDEVIRIDACLKTQTFCLYVTDQVKVVAGHYDQAVRQLKQQAQNNLAQYPKTGLLQQTGQIIVQSLIDLSTNLHRRYSDYLPEPISPTDTENDQVNKAPAKISCALSGDQLGIVLRAATDAGMIIGQSFRKICKIIAPWLSTPWRAQVSWDTLRSNSGRPEQRDKDIAVAFLEKMIVQIRSYR